MRKPRECARIAIAASWKRQRAASCSDCQRAVRCRWQVYPICIHLSIHYFGRYDGLNRRRWRERRMARSQSNHEVHEGHQGNWKRRIVNSAKCSWDLGVPRGKVNQEKQRCQRYKDAGNRCLTIRIFGPGTFPCPSAVSARDDMTYDSRPL